MKFVLIEVVEREISTPVFFDTFQESYDEMLKRIHQALGDEETFFGTAGDSDSIDNGETVVLKMSAYGERFGQNYDWKIFGF